MGPASQVFIPTISRQLAQGDKAGAHSTTRRGATLMLGYGLLVFCGALTLSPIVLPLILGEAFTPSGHVLQCFAWMFPFAAFNEFAAFYVFVPRKKDRLLAIAGAASGVANLVAALYLAPRYGAEGMAFARVIGELSLSAMLLTIMVRLELITLVPGAGRAIAMARVAWGTRGQAGAGKED
jgi:PST family polysaccharide transporter